jgi:transposase
VQLLGDHERKEPMFYYVRMEEIVPEDHLLRLIDKHIDFSFIRNKVKQLYSHTGRPSIDPEVLIRMLLIGYLYGITSERRLCEEIKMHIGYRWFVGLNLEDKVPDHSTFSKNRHERFSGDNIFQEIFDEIVTQCMDHDLLTGRHLSIDSTHLIANASFRSMEPIVVEMKPREYIDTIERENPIESKPWEPDDEYPHRGQKISNDTHRSKTDPDARLSRKSSKSATQLSHSATYVMDNKSRIIVAADTGKPDLTTDCNIAVKQIRRLKWRYRIKPDSIGVDKGYSSGEFIHALVSEKIDPHIPVRDYRSRNDKGIYPIAKFKFYNDRNVFICPEEKELKYWGVHKHSKQHVYRARTKDCKICSSKTACTRDRARSLSFHIYEDSINKARQLNETKEYRLSQRMRKRIEELFGEAKEFMGLRRAKFRMIKFVKEQVLMTATAQNIKRMVKLLSRKGPHREALAVKQLYASPLMNSILELFEWIFHYFEKLYSCKRNCPIEC